ncbi:MAG: nucleoside hydrolase [Actinomycetaceae bacterium]|nr:nucleoside hydrolase [Actinomycetaceae bacterium]
MKKIWIDCDTGFDDLIAITLIGTDPQYQIVGISTVVGNTSIDWTTSNTLSTVENFNLDAPVYRGCARPLAQDPCTIEGLLGEGGMGTINRPLPQPKHRKEESSNAVSALIEALANSDEPLTILATGPLTNIAVTLMLRPDLAENIGRIVFMGGSYGFGNHTTAAEFNAYADPEALDALIRAGLPLEMFGLNLTNQVLIRPEHADRIRQVGSEFAQTVADLLERYLRIRDPEKSQPMALHDPSAAAYLLWPELFEMKPGMLSIELHGKVSRGATFCEFRPKRVTKPNALIAMSAKGDEVANRVTERIVAALEKVVPSN